MKKKLLIIIICLIVSGCDATVKINIDNGISEKVTLTETNKANFDSVNDSGWSLRELMKSMLEKDDFEERTYNVKYKEKDNLLQLKMNDKVDLENADGLTILNQCYLKPMVKESEENILIDTGSNFKCYEYYEYLDKITVEVVSKHKVNEHNATKVEGNKYVWSFDKNSNQRIMINFKKEREVSKLPYVIASIIVIILTITILIIINSKHKSSNSI